MHDVDCVVAGAGVVGLAIARALALSGREVLVVEKAAAIGTGTSSRNSEVIHAGLHYTPGSLKARLCVNGRERLYAYCREHDVAHHRTGKLIVAVEPDQLDKLQAIQINAAQCGVGDLKLLTRAEAESLEPALSCAGALLSPSTGIVDNQALMLSLRGDAEAAGASFALLTGVSGASIEADGIRINTRDADGEGFTLKTGAFINAAGLDAQALAGRIEGLPQDRVPPLWLARGNYFALSGRSPFSRLIYPVPVHGGLGVHLTSTCRGARALARMSNGSIASTIPSIPHEALPSTTKSGATGPAWRTAPCNRPMPASGRNCPVRASRPPTSSSRDRLTTGAVRSSICSASRALALPPASPSQNMSLGFYIPMTGVPETSGRRIP